MAIGEIMASHPEYTEDTICRGKGYKCCFNCERKSKAKSMDMFLVPPARSEGYCIAQRKIK